MDLARQLGPVEEGREPRGLALQTASFDGEEEALYAPGTQKTRVSGEVVRWHLVHGAEAVPAADYIQVRCAGRAGLPVQASASWSGSTWSKVRRPPGQLTTSRCAAMPRRAAR